MQRILVILLLYVLLIDAPHAGADTPFPTRQISLQAEPIAVPPAVQARDYGPLRLTGLWALNGPRKVFGGISSLLVDGKGQFIGLSDSADAARFDLTGHARLAELPRLRGEELAPRWKQDSESMTRDPVTGRIWVGFERVQRVCRYAPGFARNEGCVQPQAALAWPRERSFESLVRFGDGRFLAISEGGMAPTGGFDALLWTGDPVDPATPPPVHLSYRGPQGYRPTDAIWLGGDRLLVLGRRLTLADGFTARLSLVRLPKLRAGAMLRGTPIADFHRPGPHDNLEALALGRDAQGRPELYIASDDNHFFLQRSLLFRFALPADWVSDAPAP